MKAVPLTWLAGRSVASLRSALRRHAPELSDGAIELQPWTEQSDPKWWYGSALVDKRFFVKFAWSQPAAQKVWHEARILDALSAHATALRTPQVVVASHNPALLVTERANGEPLTFELVGRMHRERLAHTASELARFLAALHRPDGLAGVQRAVGPVAAPLPQATTRAIREEFMPWIRSDQVSQVSRWCDWADRILEAPADVVFVQGDFHGHNHLCNHETQTLTAVLDCGESGAADPSYDFRYLPAQGPRIDLFVATATQYGKDTGMPIDISRVAAWHVRTLLGDALWRSRAGVPLPDGRTAAEWVDDLRLRLDELGMSDV